MFPGVSSTGKFLLFAAAALASQVSAQQATVSLGSSASPGGGASINVSLTTSGGAQPAGLQWTMIYPASVVATVSVAAGGSANAAGKTVACNHITGSSTICIAFGLNTTILSDGVVATATFGMNSGVVGALPPVQIAGVIVTDLHGNLIPSPAAAPIYSAPNGTKGIRAPLRTTLLRKTELGTSQAAGFTLANVATGQAGDACSPGGLAAILGPGLGVQGDAQKVDSSPLPTRLAGVQVKVNDIAAPLLYVSDSQINFQCPLLDVGTPLKLTVEGQSGVVGSPILSAMKGASPGLFIADAKNHGVVLLRSTNEIAMAATEGIPSRPAWSSESLIIYATGLGELIDGVLPGEAVPTNRWITLKNKVTVVVGELGIEPDFAGLTPGAAGLYQVNIRLSADLPIGDAIPVYLKVTLGDGTVLKSNSVNVSIQSRAE